MRPNAMMARLKWMDSLRGLMIAMVIIFHSTTRVVRYDPDALGALVNFNQVVGPYRMALLVMLSGMLLRRSLAKSRSLYFGGKVRTLLWPYLLWSVVFILLLSLTGASSETSSLLVQLLQIASGTATYLWFLFYLFAYYLISYFLSQRTRLVLIPVLMVVSVLIPDGMSDLSRFFFLLPFFWVGELIERNSDAVYSNIRKPLVLIILSLVTGVTSGLSLLNFQIMYNGVFSLGVLCGCLLLVAVVQLLGERRISNVLAWVGRSTVVFYTSHFTVIAIAYFVLNRILDVKGSILLFLFCLLSACVTGVVLVRLRSRYWIIRLLFSFPARK